MFTELFKKRAIAKAFKHLEAGSVEGLRNSLEAGVSPDAERVIAQTEFHECLLLKAVLGKAYACVDLLCERGANPNKFNEVGSSPFGDAVFGVKEAIQRDLLVFTPDLPYETHPALTIAVRLFIAGGDRKYRPSGYVQPQALDVAGAGVIGMKFEGTIDKWLEHQRARWIANQLTSQSALADAAVSRPRL